MGEGNNNKISDNRMLEHPLWSFYCDHLHCWKLLVDAECLLWAMDLAKYWLDLDLSILVTTPRGRDLSYLKDEKMDLATRINSFNNIAHNSDNETIVHQYV